ncbi:unnamed protein product [Hymenolepis diminuta]|uniref:Uncharacterized protein n=1 Tax=Hymenolepis diminuta TaxID=6216 RepID=A0A564Z6S7_HYMDI|nr:unnamed protein product [Hymenolepis diminuta]
MMNLTCDSAFILTPRLRVWCLKCMRICLNGHYLQHRQIFLSNGMRPYLVNAAESGIFLNNVSSSRIGVSSIKGLDVKKVVAHTLPPECPSLPPTTCPRLVNQRTAKFS